MKIEQIYTGCLSEAAYYIESERESVIIDPLREVEPYIEKAKENNSQIKYILETHFHADFVSGHVELAKKTGAIIVLEQSNSLEFIKSSGDEAKIEISPQIIESIFYKNGPLHDGAIIIKGNTITATRIILPVSDSTSIPKRYGLRHKAGIGITEKTDALVIVVSEQRGDVTYIKDGELERISSSKKLQDVLNNYLSS